MSAIETTLFGFMSRFNQRERALLGVLMLVFFVTAVGVLYMMRKSSFDEARAEIAELREGLVLVRTKGTAYDTKKKEKEAREARIANAQPIVFSILLEEAQKSLVTGTLRGEEERQAVAVDDKGLFKRVVAFEVRNVALEELLTFLAKLEAQPGNILFVERLMLRSPSALEDRLNAEVELATWELQKQEEAAPAPAAEEGES
ncbi:hypothetical protein [Nannocystis punicea]|uniref:General secretion pathway protein M n=1 Tax=Nannocystis punicea TaxID=2995304 RepID=A0ABY7HGJ1_9BACT|nr:hypothetical protein [Nannocystis poenicansa]WAS98180.1 hypothetical protein O0S08_18730 [Nannocystis poenicansa]